MLRGLGKDVTLHVHEAADHTFFNDARPEVYDAEASLEAWERTLALFHEQLTPSPETAWRLTFVGSGGGN